MLGDGLRPSSEQSEIFSTLKWLSAIGNGATKMTDMEPKTDEKHGMCASFVEFLKKVPFSWKAGANHAYLLVMKVFEGQMLVFGEQFQLIVAQPT